MSHAVVARAQDDGHVLRDINTFSGNSNPAGITVLDDLLIFSATDLEHGTEVWASDGTTA